MPKKHADRPWLVINCRIEQWEHDALTALAAEDRRSVANLVMVLLAPHLRAWRDKHAAERGEE